MERGLSVGLLEKGDSATKRADTATKPEILQQSVPILQPTPKILQQPTKKETIFACENGPSQFNSNLFVAFQQ